MAAATPAPIVLVLTYLSLSSWFDDVPTGHAEVLVRRHVTVVEPSPRVVLAPAGSYRFVGSDGRAVDERARGVLPPVPMHVEGVEVRVAADHVQGHVLPDLRADRRRVARGHAAVEALHGSLEARDLRHEVVHHEHLF